MSIATISDTLTGNLTFIEEINEGLSDDDIEELKKMMSDDNKEVTDILEEHSELFNDNKAKILSRLPQTKPTLDRAEEIFKDILDDMEIAFNGIFDSGPGLK
jgi:uncharacterized UBP type Zn finger protein